MTAIAPSSEVPKSHINTIKHPRRELKALNLRMVIATGRDGEWITDPEYHYQRGLLSAMYVRNVYKALEDLEWSILWFYNSDRIISDGFGGYTVAYAVNEMEFQLLREAVRLALLTGDIEKADHYYEGLWDVQLKLKNEGDEALVLVLQADILEAKADVLLAEAAQLEAEHKAVEAEDRALEAKGHQVFAFGAREKAAKRWRGPVRLSYRSWIQDNDYFRMKFLTKWLVETEQQSVDGSENLQRKKHYRELIGYTVSVTGSKIPDSRRKSIKVQGHPKLSRRIRALLIRSFAHQKPIGKLYVRFAH